VPVHDGGYQVRQWIAVEDFAKGLILAAEYLLDQIPRGQVATFNLAGPTRCSVRDLVRAFYGKARGECWLDGGARPGQDRCYHLSGERARSVLGLRPVRDILDRAEIERLLRHYAPVLEVDESA
jgi:nucleoside-diphosphate-sugar epimerase